CTKTFKLILATWIYPWSCSSLSIPVKAQSDDIGHSISFQYAQLGDNVTLKCFYPDIISHVSWYKQTAGQKPQPISTIYRYNDEAKFHNDFKDNPRFTVPGGKGVFHLRISKFQPSDSAMYYCGAKRGNFIEFSVGIFLILKGSSKTVVQQPVSESVLPGDSVTLNCTINTGTCEGEHSVYWFRHDSRESPPGIIYTNGDRSGQCMKSPESGSPTQSCVYNLPKSNLSLSDTGTYYCAVASCGEILFGNGTKLDGDHLVLLYCLKTALVLCVVLIVVLTCVLYKISNSSGKYCCHVRYSLLLKLKYLTYFSENWSHCFTMMIIVIIDCSYACLEGMHPQPSDPADPSHNQVHRHNSCSYFYILVIYQDRVKLVSS
uniref:Ig-like domain-containing protein n=1 Tax=Esox lucius TaxID=8010 RepID=A0A6Q2XHQ9_ESOLU